MDAQKLTRYNAWLADVNRIAARHGITSRQLVSVLFEYAPGDGWRRLFDYVESNDFARHLLSGPDLDGDIEREIQRLRDNGHSVEYIASRLDLPVETIESFIS